LALLMYAQDYDEALPAAYQWVNPPNAWPLFKWAATTVPYTKNSQIFRCPSDQPANDSGDWSVGPISYGANPNLMPGVRGNFSAPIGTIARPAECMLICDAWAASRYCMQPNYVIGGGVTCYARPAGLRPDNVDISRHNGGFNACLADGHGKWYTGGREDWNALSWQRSP